MHVAKRENPIVNRLNKTKVERQVDHEQERIERIKEENAARRVAAQQKVRLSSATIGADRTSPFARWRPPVIYERWRWY